MRGQVLRALARMGSTNGASDEQPVKTVTMTGFQLGQTEVSVADYQAHLTETPDTHFQAVVSGYSSGNASQSLSAEVGETVTALFNRVLQIFSSNSRTKIEVTKSTSALSNFSKSGSVLEGVQINHPGHLPWRKTEERCAPLVTRSLQLCGRA